MSQQQQENVSQDQVIAACMENFLLIASHLNKETIYTILVITNPHFSAASFHKIINNFREQNGHVGIIDALVDNIKVLRMQQEQSAQCVVIMSNLMLLLPQGQEIAQAQAQAFQAALEENVIGPVKNAVATLLEADRQLTTKTRD
jgi:hypothetical protein